MHIYICDEAWRVIMFGGGECCVIVFGAGRVWDLLSLRSSPCRLTSDVMRSSQEYEVGFVRTSCCPSEGVAGGVHNHTRGVGS